MNEKYKSEIEDFERNFEKYKDKKIVLYGIGRMTVTLLESDIGYCFVGLLDKNPETIGKKICGIPVLDLKTACAMADVIIINTSATYWNIIAARLRDVTIPVFYKNGNKVIFCNDDLGKYDYYWELRIEDLKKKIDSHEAIVFDFYDTLFMRKTYSAQDIFCYIGAIIKKNNIYNYEFARKKAIVKVESNYNIYELYDQISDDNNWECSLKNDIEELEISIEEELLQPREKVIELMKFAQSKLKDVFVVSDMYLPKSFFLRALKMAGLDISESNIYISNECKKKKEDGSIWQYFCEKNKVYDRILCIGDNIESDVRMPTRISRRFDAIYLASSRTILEMSSLKSIAPNIGTLESSAIMGLIVDKLFNNPMVLNDTKGQVYIDNPIIAGYVVLGPVLLEFYRWLLNRAKLDDVNELLFVARDGYFIKPGFELFLTLMGVDICCKYVGISRQLAMIASIESNDDLMDYLQVPYTGSCRDMLEDRFNYSLSIDVEEVDFSELFISNKNTNELTDEMWKYIKRVKKNYLRYLDKLDIGNHAAIVDTGYYGNNQRYLNKLFSKEYVGYYFNANLDMSNPNANTQKMFACFQDENDKKASKSGIFNKVLFLESILTAPYGMIVEVNELGEFICKKGGKNQEHFSIKEKIFEGAKDFITDYVTLYGRYNLKIDHLFVDKWYEICNDKILYTGDLRYSFYYDNAFLNRFDNAIFD